MMNMQNMNNAIENMNKGLEDTNGWKITFIKDGKEETMKFSKDIIVNEALNKYKIKIGEAGNLKLKFVENKKPVSLSLKIFTTESSSMRFTFAIVITGFLAYN